MHRSHRVAGALVGSAVGDALGAPFESGPAGQFSARFPTAARGTRTEMCGGGAGGWAPGEFTDTTGTALLVATSLVEHGKLDAADGSLGSATPAAIWFARYGRDATTDDPAAAVGRAVFHELVRVA